MAIEILTSAPAVGMALESEATAAAGHDPDVEIFADAFESGDLSMWSSTSRRWY